MSLQGYSLIYKIPKIKDPYKDHYWCSKCLRYIPKSAVFLGKPPRCPKCNTKLRTRPKRRREW